MTETTTLTTEQIELITKIASQTASQTASIVAIEQYKQEQLQEEKQKHDRRLRNVKLLLRNYRMFVLHVDDTKQDINSFNAALALDELDTDEFAVQSIIRSKERTLMLIKFIDRMLSIYKLICEQSHNPEEKRRYETIHYTYMAEQKMTAAEISALQSIAERTVFYDLKKAHEELTTLIFGVDGLRFQ